MPISVSAIDKHIPVDVEYTEVSHLLSQPLIQGDCRRIDLLEGAGITSARTILLLTKDESVNVETALLVRRHYPTVHIVIRSARSNLNDLLKNRLSQFVALNATELPAETFALAGVGNELLSIIEIEQCQFRVIQQQIMPEEHHYVKMPLHQMHRRQSRLLTFSPQAASDHKLEPSISASKLFHCWQPETYVLPRDTVSLIHVESVSQTQHGAVYPKAGIGSWLIGV